MVCTIDLTLTKNSVQTFNQICSRQQGFETPRGRHFSINKIKDLWVFENTCTSSAQVFCFTQPDVGHDLALAPLPNDSCCSCHCTCRSIQNRPLKSILFSFESGDCFVECLYQLLLPFSKVKLSVTIRAYSNSILGPIRTSLRKLLHMVNL